MECNKDEAVRAKEIAERKFTERDFAGAKKFALKAQNLYPQLEGISQMLVTFDVCASAEKRTITGEVDWYSMLGISPWADDETVRKQYRKLALMLHPDKNKSLGADGAFKLVLEAWSLLSDKAKRLAYNEKLNVAGFQQRVSTQNKFPSAPSTSNGFHNSKNAVNTNARAQNKNTRTMPPSVPSTSDKKPDTFWTICNRCKTQYEYLRIYLNHTLLCPNCHVAFFAVEKALPPNVTKSSSFIGKAGAEWKTGNSALGVDHLFKRRRSDETYMNGANLGNVRAGLETAFEQRRGCFEKERVYGFSNISCKLNIKRELLPFEVRNMLMEKAQLDICKKLEEWRSNRVKLIENRKQKSMLRNDTSNHKKHGDSAGMTYGNQSKKAFPCFSSYDSTEMAPAPLIINVPDSDFHNFDLDRTESSFGDDQVWAAYDGNDGMPRYYARIHQVISKNPFKMMISWLNSRTNREFSSVDWIGCGFPKTCGDFRAGKHEISESLNSFSHKVKWTKGTRGAICVLPGKGDIWALYKSWSRDWDQQTPDEVVHQYEMVEVLGDYSEEQGVSVVPLIKVAGFKAVFHRHFDAIEIKRIPKEEMFRFSHQVPNHLLAGEEALNAPKGCRELDPAATPLELIQIKTEANEAQTMESVENQGR